MAQQAKPTLRVLCLHGAGLSSEIFKMQLASYAAPLQNTHNISLHFLDAPIPTPPHPTLPASYAEPTFRWFHWAPSPKPFSMVDVRESSEYIRAHVEKEGPFDGVLGFSQGCAIAVAILQGCGAPSGQTKQPFKFAILFNSPSLPRYDAAAGKPVSPMWGELDTPSLHVAGEADEWFDGSMATYEDFCEEGTAKMVTHEGGHAMPKDAEVMRRIMAEVGDLLKRAGCK